MLKLNFPNLNLLEQKYLFVGEVSRMEACETVKFLFILVGGMKIHKNLNQSNHLDAPKCFFFHLLPKKRIS